MPGTRAYGQNRLDVDEYTNHQTLERQTMMRLTKSSFSATLLPPHAPPSWGWYCRALANNTL
eukprot:1668229-Lingulodinium_polyedra.AAC.1